jgi:molecular chaperone GrpE (heat shock protein)
MDRDEILRRFEQWLDEALAATDPPSGIDAEILTALSAESADETARVDRPDDAYALWSAMTALTQEVKLQSRTFKALSDGLDSQPSRIGDEIRAAYHEREREMQREVERRCRREILGALVDVRDRLGRGLDSVRESASAIADAARRGWLARIWTTQRGYTADGRLAALTKGYELGVERLDQMLDDFGARQIRSERQPFDPRRMNAVDRQESSEVPDGTVLEVYRSGYEWNGEVFRSAQVKVSCALGGNEHE